MSLRVIHSAFVAVSLIVAGPALAQSPDMTFFVTSAGIGNGGNLGGLAGADNQCQTLAQAAGAGSKTWRAYLSTQAADGKPAVNAKDRIGRGPWQNAKGAVVAKDVSELHGTNNVVKQTALNEKGEVINGFGDTPNRHGHIDRIAAGRNSVCGKRRPDLQELDEQHARRGNGRPFRYQRAGDKSDGEILERGTSVARTGRRLLASRPEEHRRRRLALLFRGELTQHG